MRAVIFCAPLPYRPRFEAISKEIGLLLPEDGSGLVVSIPPFASRPWAGDPDPGVRVVHPLRLLSPLTARRAVRGGELLHIFTTLPLPLRIGLLLRNAGLPSIVTAVSHGGLGPSDLENLRRSSRVVAECPRDLDRLRGDGLSASKLQLIRPAAAFDARPLPPPDAPLTILFASSPLQAAEFEQRGVDLLVAAARRLPDVRFHLLWRPGAEQCLAALEDVPNLRVDRTLYDDITEVLASVHAVVAPFRTGGKAKSVPLSIIEGIACGRPALVSSAVGVADLVAEHGCGLVFEPVADRLVEAIESFRQHEEELRTATRIAAATFDRQAFRGSYAELVRDVMHGESAAG